MQRTTLQSTLTLLGAAILAVLVLAPVRLAGGDSGKPLNEREVLELLKGGVRSSRVGEIVDDRGIDFDFTAESEQRVREAGGADDVVAALQRASQRRAAADQPRTGGLILKTTPGETQVYLNDEPKGMTSVEGDIRLLDLRPGTYALRISLPGYQSYEKPMTVTAGEPQTVYVTLVQKPGDNPGKDNPNPQHDPSPVTLSSTGLPIPDVKPPVVQFYEGPREPAPEHDQRVYRYNFDRFSARSIYWELDLTFPAPQQRIDFEVVAIWHRPDGSEMTRQKFPAYVKETWKSSWHTLGFGYAEPGHWTPGSYRVDFYCRDVQIATGTFQID